MPKYRVRYTVSFDTFIECEPGELVDEVPNIFIPEDDENKYVDDTYETDGIFLQKSNGQEVEVDDDGRLMDEAIEDFEEIAVKEVAEDDGDEEEDDYF